ncbi:hypothetical protein D9619_001315 [Psilocybe cf. subviscida]|uniref:F-box domain-containing protein n=1 Tax=Psilocybe cf. subviscida TaxID=2480587 RepID=A0A8H5F2K6_9AGAR|nr:hypothetical protein D9619_001315 [Psilocybe cf. subviscida]
MAPGLLNQILPSEVLNALSNNDSQDVIRTVKVFRENPASLSSVIDRRIDDIDKRISALELEKSQLGSSEGLRLAIEETYATICAPLRTIPRDILREIAHHSLDAHPSPARNHSPMSLTHVSSVWRSVVADSPSLRTTLYLRIQQANLDSLVKHLQVVQTWFHRAGSLPVQLFIYVDRTLGHKRNTAHNFRMFLKALAPWASRIRHLGIGGRHWVNLITKFVDIKWDLSDLVWLDFLGQMADCVPVCSRNEINELASICDKVTLFRTAKRLTTVVASQELSVHLQAFSFLPWSQVQHITLEEHEASGPEFLALMKQCPQLRTAALVWYQCGMSALGAPYAVKKMEKLQRCRGPFGFS